MTVLDARLFPNCKLPFKTGALRVLGAEKGGEASSTVQQMEIQAVD